MALVSLGWSVAHPASAMLERIPSEWLTWRVTDDHASLRTWESGTLRREVVGGRCVTRMGGAPIVTPTCPARTRVWDYGYNVAAVETTVESAETPSRLWARPGHVLTFVEVGGRVYGPHGVAYRYVMFAAPLWEWCVGAAFGVLVAWWSILRTRRALAMWRALPVRAGVSCGAEVRLDDGTALRLPEALSSHVGDVLVIGDGDLGAVFRTVPGAEGRIVLPVDRLAWDRALTDSEQLNASFSRAVVWLSAAPLAAAPFLGMFSPWP